MRMMVIGGGAWGRHVIRNAFELNILSGIVEGDSERSASYDSAYPHIARFEDWREALVTDCDAVAIVTPTETHREIALGAIAAGKDVFVEKPIARNVSDAREMAEAAQAAGRVMMVGHLLLFHPAIQRIAALLHAGEIGALVALRQERLGLGRVRSTESVTWDLAVHDVAAMYYLIGTEPNGIQAIGTRLLGRPVLDEIQAQFTFTDNIRADLHCSWFWPQTQRRTIVRGTRGMLVFNETRQTLTRYNRWIDANLEARDEGHEYLDIENTQSLRAELAHFAEKVADRGRPRSNALDAVKVIQILERIEIAANAAVHKDTNWQGLHV